MWDYILGELDDKQIQTISEHIKTCPKCQKDYDIEMTLHRELLEVTEDAPSLNFSDKVISQIEKHWQVKTAHRFWFKFTKVAIIHAIIIAVGLSLLMMAFQNTTLSMDRQLVAKVALPGLSVCMVLWLLYAMDVLLKRHFNKNIH